MLQLDARTLVSVISAIIAFVSLAAVLYKEFLQGAKLSTAVDRISLLRVPPSSRNDVTAEILLDDLLSGARSDQANALMDSVPGLRQTVNSRDRHQIRSVIEAYARDNPIVYDPPRVIIERYLQDRRFVTNFYVPLIIANSGRKTAHVSSLVVVCRDRSDRSKTWAFVPYLSIDPKLLLPRPGETSDSDRIAGMFVGVSVPPMSAVHVDPWFVPLPDADNRIISRTNMPAGNYEVRVYGYGSNGKRLFRTGPTSLQISSEQLVNAFLGIDCVNNLTIDKHVSDAVRDSA